jgi:predicted nucleic acid-binding Zn ribbon protein
MNPTPSKYGQKFLPLIMQWQQKDSSRKRDTAPLKDVFDELLEAYRIKDRYNERKVVAEWESLMGKTVSSRTNNLSVKNRILYVQLSSGAIKKEMMMHKSKVMALIAEKYGDQVIQDIVFL